VSADEQAKADADEIVRLEAKLDAKHARNSAAWAAFVLEAARLLLEEAEKP
jgi:uncharacterized small protein (DUF1192 family)